MFVILTWEFKLKLGLKQDLGIFPVFVPSKHSGALVITVFWFSNSIYHFIALIS